MVFSVKATYNGETRRWINADDAFPTYQALADQIHRVFKTVDRFYISSILFSPTGSDPGASLVSNRVRNAQEWADLGVAGPHLGKFYPDGSLRFVVQDVLEHRIPSAGRASWGYDMEVDVDTTHAQQGAEAATPQSNRNSIISTGSNGSCCSLASTKIEVKGMVDNFLKEFQKTMSETFGDDTHMADATPTVSAPSHERTPVQSARPLSPERPVPGAFDVPANSDDEAIHRGVMCDHCHKIVKGVRYKCKVCIDFDLCQECVGENNHGGVVHSAQYDVEHPFRSIVAPQRRRRLHEAIAASRARASQATSESNSKLVHNAYCDVCGKTIVGNRHKCLDCFDYDMCDECITNKRNEHYSHHQFLELKEPGRVIVHTVADPIPPTNVHAINPPNFSQASNEDRQGPHHRRGLDHEHRHQFGRHPAPLGHGWRPHMGESPDEPHRHHHRHHGRHGHPLGMPPFLPPPPMPGVFPMVPPPPPPPLFSRFPPPPPPPPPVVLPTMVAPAAPAARAPATPNPVAHNANCDMCDSKIFGVRHKCLTCPDYDVCASCFAIVPEQHPKHPFVMVNHPKDLLVKPVHITNRTVHSAGCDACRRKIIGVRYKCLHPSCPDYDLCENCEALPIDTHPSSHAMVKMKQPLYSYEGLRKIFYSAREVEPAVVVVTPKASPKVNPVSEVKPIEKLVDVGESGQAPVMTRSPIAAPVVVSIPPPMVPVPVPVPAPITINRQWFEQFATASEVEAPILFQGEGEKAKSIVLSSRASSVSSSVSGELIEKTESLHLENERPTAVVPQQISETESPFTDDNAVRSVTPSSVSVTSVTSAPVEAPLRASFIADNTIPDGFVIPAGTAFVKSWKIVNNGETSWPSSVRLVFAGGERLGTAKNTSVPVMGEVKPGDEYDVSISFVAPSTIGHFISYWCMEDGQGQTFGHRLWCDIEVVEPVEKSSNTPLSSSTVIMPAPASVAATSPITATPLSPTEFATPAFVPTPTISSAPSEVDLDDDNESDVSGLWEDATRAPSPDEFVMVYDSVSDGDSDM